ncbi:MAG: DUF5367 domain-containing protein [Bacteroidota bacterium]
MNYKSFSVAYGFGVWLMATLVFRFWGHTFFLVEHNLLLAGFFLATIPTLYLSTYWVFKKFSLTGAQRMESAVLMAIPGMIGDVVCLKLHQLVFPTLDMNQAVVLGSWILWAYVLVLIIGVYYAREGVQSRS